MTDKVRLRHPDLTGEGAVIEVTATKAAILTLQGWERADTAPTPSLPPPPVTRPPAASVAPPKPPEA